MLSTASPLSPPGLEAAIDRHPLMVNPGDSVADVIALMGKAQSSCNLPSLNLSLNIVLMSQARASAVLVVEGETLVGIFAEQEALKAIASGQNLHSLLVRQVIRTPAIALAPPDQDVFTALSLLRQHQIHHLPVVDQQGLVLGIITPPGIRRVLQLDELLKSRQLAELIHRPVVQAAATRSILEVAQLMVTQQVDCVVLSRDVAPGKTEPVGLITGRDIIMLTFLGLDLAQITAQTVMHPSVLRFAPSELVLSAYWQMQQHRVQYLLVAEEPIANSSPLLSIVTPTTFLYTLDQPLMEQAVAQIQRSIAQPPAEGTIFSPSEQTNLTQEASDTPEELRQQLQCSRLLTDMALRIRESLQLTEILQTAVDEVRQFLQTERVIIYQFNPDMSGTVVVESVASGLTPALNSTIQDSCFGQNYAQAYREGRIQVVEDIYTAGLTQCHIDILVLYSIRASLVVPILQGEHLWGLLCAYHCSNGRRWRPFEVDLLKQLATHIAIAIQQSELYQQAQTELAERKRTEEQLKISLKEKESLLKEVHHRVKNNLQIISSLLRLQSDYIRDEKTLSLFKDSQNRIRSMALIHEKLYQSKDVLRIDFGEYIYDLVSNLLHSYTAHLQSINLRVESHNIWLSIDTAIPCGLIVNELVSNSVKHAFPNQNEDNEIAIEISLTDNNKYKMTVRDNGIGFPQNIDFCNTESLGLQLVCAFTEQLEGTVELDNTNGTTFTITFIEIETSRKA
jgi:two-component sensor histidine kinase/CBS domain-containing protein